MKAAHSIVQIGHPALRAKAHEVPPHELGTAKLQTLCDGLVETMRAAGGAASPHRRWQSRFVSSQSR